MGYSVGGSLRYGTGGSVGGARVLREVTDPPYWAEAEGRAPSGDAPPRAGTEPAPWERDPDAAEALGDEIATLAAHIHAATHRMLVLIAKFDRLRGWEAGGHRSCAYWLSYRTSPSCRWWGKGRPAFIDTKGHVHMEGRKRRPELPEDPVPALERRNRERGLDA